MLLEIPLLIERFTALPEKSSGDHKKYIKVEKG